MHCTQGFKIETVTRLSNNKQPYQKYYVYIFWYDTNQNPRTLIPVLRTWSLKSVADCSQFRLNFPVWRRLITHTILYRALYWPLRSAYKTVTNSLFLVFKNSFTRATLDNHQSIKRLLYKYAGTHISTRLTQFIPQPLPVTQNTCKFLSDKALSLVVSYHSLPPATLDTHYISYSTAHSSSLNSYVNG